MPQPRRIRVGGKKPGGPSKDPAARQRQLDALARANEARRNGKKNAPWGSLREPGQEYGGESLLPITTHKELALRAREYSHEAIAYIVGVLRSPGSSRRDKLFAANILLDRGFGKAPVLVKLAGDRQAEAEENARGAPQLTEMPREQFSREILKILIEAGEIRYSDLDDAQRPGDAAETVVEPDPLKSPPPTQPAPERIEAPLHASER
jgi:hypothetical protein